MSTNSYGWAAPVYGKGGGGGTVTNPNLRSVMPGAGGFDQVYTAAAYPGGPNNPMPPPPANNPNLTGARGTQVDPFAYTSNSQGQDLLNTIAGGGWKLNDAGAWGGSARSALEDYMNNFFTPYMNAQNATETQKFNEANATQNFGEQQRVNSSQMALAQQDSSRQNLALGYGQANNTRDFGETQRQFNAGNANDVYANQTNRTNVANQYNLGQGQNANTLLNYQNQYALGKAQNTNQAADIANQYKLGNQSNANTLTNYQNQYALGQGQLSNDQYSNQTNRTNVANQYALGQGQLGNDQYANQTNRTNVANQYTLGQGQNNNQSRQISNDYTLGQGNLGLQNRTLDTTNAFNQQKLGQDAALTREGYVNDLRQQQIQATGRLAGPNTRALRSWY